MNKDYLLISPANIPVWWPRVAPWILQAIGESETWSDINTIRDALEQGFAHLWVIKSGEADISCALISEPTVVGGKQYLVLRWCGGEKLDTWINDIAVVENYAKNRGFYGIQVWGRKGWEKLLRPMGYHHEYSVVSKVLERGLH